MRFKGKLIRCMVLFAMRLAKRKVEILGIQSQPKGSWMEQIARNLTCEDIFLESKRYVIHDRDPLYTDKSDGPLRAEIIPVTPR